MRASLNPPLTDYEVIHGKYAVAAAELWSDAKDRDDTNLLTALELAIELYEYGWYPLAAKAFRAIATDPVAESATRCADLLSMMKDPMKPKRKTKKKLGLCLPRSHR
jgi:hypothetical protein